MRISKVLLLLITSFCLFTTGFLVINVIQQETTEFHEPSALITSQTGYIEVVVREDGTLDFIEGAAVSVYQGAVQIGNTEYTDSNGFLNFTATATDTHGNVNTGAKTVSKDTVAPDVNISSVTDPINSDNETNTSASGTRSFGATLSIKASDGPHETTPQSLTTAPVN